MNLPAEGISPGRPLRILDTTLRDGDQAAGFAFSHDAKLKLALALAEAGVDIIETGFPLSSSVDFESCRVLAEELAGFPSLTAVMSRGRLDDIRESARVFEGRPGLLHISLPVSKIHIEAKLGKTEADVLAMAREAVSYAAGLVPQVELGAEDASRADPSFLAEYCHAVFEAGASVVNIADTLGLLSPSEIAALVRFLKEKTPQGILSVHCHNDLGLATANTLAAVEAGCGQVEVSVSGLGERAGNACLEEIAANLAQRPAVYGNVRTGLRLEKIPALVSLAAEAAGTSGSPMKPLSGWNVRAHGAGIHQQGLYRDAETYAAPWIPVFAMVPERIVLSRHSGIAGAALFSNRCLGFDLDADTLSRMTAYIKSSPLYADGAAGITEFLCILADLQRLPSGYSGPLVVIDWSERIAKDRTEFSANLGFYGKTTGTPVSVVEVRGGGGTGTEAVMDALGCLAAEVLGSPADSTPDLELQRLSINGAGKKMRLYAEIAAGGRPYAAERAGETGAGGLLFLCGLDVLNAELLRRTIADDNGGKNEQAGIIVEDFSQ